jgi:hypothetical protein
MDDLQQRQLNESAYRQLSAAINKTYPSGQFVAIAGGQVVADAGRFEELQSALRAQGRNPARVLIVQAGVEYPASAVILSQGVRQKPVQVANSVPGSES